MRNYLRGCARFARNTTLPRGANRYRIVTLEQRRGTGVTVVPRTVVGHNRFISLWNRVRIEDFR